MAALGAKPLRNRREQIRAPGNASKELGQRRVLCYNTSSLTLAEIPKKEIA